MTMNHPQSVVDAASVRLHPLGGGLAPAPVELEMTRLLRGVVAALPGGPGLSVLVAGVHRGAGATRIATGLADTAARSGLNVGSVDLSGPSGQREGIPFLARPMGADLPAAQPGVERWPLRRHGLDLLIVDAAPIAASTLTMLLAAHASGVLLVVEADRTTQAQIHEALVAVKDCGGSCLGLVLNRRRGRWALRR